MLCILIEIIQCLRRPLSQKARSQDSLLFLAVLGLLSCFCLAGDFLTGLALLLVLLILAPLPLEDFRDLTIMLRQELILFIFTLHTQASHLTKTILGKHGRMIFGKAQFIGCNASKVSSVLSILRGQALQKKNCGNIASRT